MRHAEIFGVFKVSANAMTSNDLQCRDRFANTSRTHEKLGLLSPQLQVPQVGHHLTQPWREFDAILGAISNSNFTAKWASDTETDILHHFDSDKNHR